MRNTRKPFYNTEITNDNGTGSVIENLSPAGKFSLLKFQLLAVSVPPKKTAAVNGLLHGEKKKCA